MRQIKLTLCLGLLSLMVGAAAVDGDAAKGATKVSQCLGCHGIDNYQTSFPEIYRVPKIAGQNREYLMSALHDYRSGARKHPTMRATASSLSDQDIADIASYFEQRAKP